MTAASGFLRGALIVGAMTGLSRLTGFARDLLIAAFLGAGAAADAFFVAFKLANFLRRMFVEGAFAAAFVPVFTGTLHDHGPEKARRLADDALTLLFLALAAVVALGELAMPWLVRLLATGFDPAGERYALAVQLSRITFPYLHLISLAALYAGVLNGLGRFAAAAFAPVLLNLCLVAALLLARTLGWSPEFALAWGVALAGACQLVWVAVAAARAGFFLRLRRPRRSPALDRLLRLLGPGAAGAGIGQITLLVNSWFASWLPPGAVSHLFYADRLVQLPLGLVGVALGTALLPQLVRLARTAPEAATSALNRATEAALVLTLPAALGLFILARPIVTVLFERGAFEPTATTATAGALAAMAVGLPALVLLRVLGPAFFARQDTRTPMWIGLGAVVLDIVLITILVGPLAETGIALAGSLAAWLAAALQVVLLTGRGWFAGDGLLRRRLPRIALASLGMAALMVICERSLHLGSGVLLFGTIGLGVAAFLLLLLATGAFALADLRALRRSAEA
ncbi:MAG: murein biosynthesis integral membrane protein MurJ [Geminicoccaceae bacterium]